MNILAQFNFFWQKHLEYQFTPNEVAVYYHLLNFCNSLGRKNPFNMAKSRLLLEMGLKTDAPLDTARKRLREAGLIDYQNGNGKGNTTLYTLTPAPRASEEAEPETPAERGQKNPPLSAEEAPNTPEQRGKERGEKNTPLTPTLSAKSGQRGKERGEKNNPQKGGTTLKKRKDTSTVEVELSEGLRWVAENAPEVQRLQNPLTDAQWEKLLADFGRATLEEVLLAMQNYRGLTTKYTTANLTARDWCKRRQPNGPPPPAPDAAAKPSYNTADLFARKAPAPITS